MAAGTEIFRLFGRIMIETSDAERSLSKTESKAKAFLGTIGNGVATVAKFAGAVGAAALTAAGAATKVAADFRSQMSNVQTLLTGTQDEIAAKVSKYGDIVKEVSRTTGLETSNLTDGLYQVVSAFGDVDDAAKIMETAAKSAKAGNAETSDAVNLLSAVTKGYGDISAEANQKAADLAFTTVRLGQTSFPELASSMGKVIPLCATMKVKEEELFGAMATLTGVTGGTAEVSTQLKATIQGFMQPTTAMTSALKKMGYENGQAAIESLGLQGALDALKESVNGDELAFAGMFSSVEATVRARIFVRARRQFLRAWAYLETGGYITIKAARRIISYRGYFSHTDSVGISAKLHIVEVSRAASNVISAAARAELAAAA